MTQIIPFPTQKAAQPSPAPTAAQLRQQYPTLIPHTETGKSKAASAAINIRIELKAAFPGVKFRVVSDSFAGGTSVHIGWQDGPSNAEVEAIVDRYQYGDFDGMDDSYNHRKDDGFRDLFGDAKYVQPTRTLTDAFIQAWFDKNRPGEKMPERETHEWFELRSAVWRDAERR